MSICGGIVGARGRNPNSIFIHNDAGSQAANANFYNVWLRTHDLATGFAHYYVADDYTLQAEDDNNCAWHCGSYSYNSSALSIEVCQSMGNKDIFLANEQKALQLAAQKCKQYGIVPSESTIRLHQEVYATACPHRSVDLHGGAKATKQYFIAEIKKYMGQGTNVSPAVGLPGINLETEGKDMHGLFTIDKGITVYYFDGSCIKKLTHPDELNALNQFHKAETGKDLPVLNYSSKAPYYIRLLHVLQREPVKSF